jgi:hypothetical protein
MSKLLTITTAEYSTYKFSFHAIIQSANFSSDVDPYNATIGDTLQSTQLITQ